MLTITKGIIFGLLLILFILISIGFLIAAILKRKNKKKLLLFIFVSLFFFVFSVVTFVFIIRKVAVSVVDNTDRSQQYIEDKLKDAFSSGFPDTPQLDSIKALQPDSVEIPKAYFTFYGEWDYYRMPLIYPYAMNAIDGLDVGYLTDETGLESFYNTNASIQLQHGITRFAFDRKLFIAEQKMNVDKPAKYIIFSFDNFEVESFDSLADMLESAKRKGFDTNKSMVNIRDYYMSLVR